MSRPKQPVLIDKHVDPVAAAERQRQAQNNMLVDRIKGVPGQPATPETDADPRNPNVRPSEEIVREERSEWPDYNIGG